MHDRVHRRARARLSASRPGRITHIVDRSCWVKSLVVFIPFPFTGICDGEVCAIRDDLASLSDLDARVIVITCHARPTNAKWATENGMDFPVLSDFWPHGEVARAYGVFDERVGVANRTTFVLDAEGVVRDVVSSDSLGTAREHDAYAAALEAV